MNKFAIKTKAKDILSIGSEIFFVQILFLLVSCTLLYNICIFSLREVGSVSMEEYHYSDIRLENSKDRVNLNNLKNRNFYNISEMINSLPESINTTAGNLYADIEYKGSMVNGLKIDINKFHSVEILYTASGIKMIEKKIPIIRHVEKQYVSGPSKNLAYNLKKIGISDSAIKQISSYFLPSNRAGTSSITVLRDKFIGSNGEFSHYGNPRYIKIVARNNIVKEFYNYKGEYYFLNGNSIERKEFIKPIEKARISSPFGKMRTINNHTRIHKGVDLAAPIGTPIKASYAGVITHMQRRGAYGNYIKITHSNGVETVYAHMRNFAKKLYIGKRVNTGEVIGYVGLTGRTTGPHLHHELRVNNVHVDPMKTKIPQKKLTSVSYRDFKRYYTYINQINKSVKVNSSIRY